MIITQVDAFTDTVFAGNPAAVCLLPESRPEHWMQRVANEMNLSETAFLERRVDGAFDLRWFTPAVEVDLCGHATLASAHVLWEQGECAPGVEIRFHTRSGVLAASRRDGWIELDFPALPEQCAPPPPGLAAALGVEPHYVGRNRFDYLAELESDAAVRALRPDMHGLRAIDMRGLIVTARAAEASFDFVSRFFAPAAGIDEDPVTGSAHCCLGPFWRRRLDKAVLTGRQVSARGGVVRVAVDGARVKLLGQAVTVFVAELAASETVSGP
jgi:predicted PhzF superfamily epimerase YddE/YHI9